MVCGCCYGLDKGKCSSIYVQLRVNFRTTSQILQTKVIRLGLGRVFGDEIYVKKHSPFAFYRVRTDPKNLTLKVRIDLKFIVVNSLYIKVSEQRFPNISIFSI